MAEVLNLQPDRYFMAGVILRSQVSGTSFTNEVIISKVFPHIDNIIDVAAKKYRLTRPQVMVFAISEFSKEDFEAFTGVKVNELGKKPQK